MNLHLSTHIASRKAEIYKMFTTAGTFLYDGKLVCKSFIAKAFRMDLHLSVK